MWDIFISHASEDKDAIARPLAEALVGAGLTIWYGEFTLQLGDSLRRSIDRGLANAPYGIVILSPAFLATEWPLIRAAPVLTRSSRYWGRMPR
ncbi:MAG: toll/interleukin-1 receptor domain-containing protein [Methylococcales bacterium]